MTEMLYVFDLIDKVLSVMISAPHPHLMFLRLVCRHYYTEHSKQHQRWCHYFIT